jgi:glycosyltransferase involved in cell wall biosynthesis
MLTVAMMLQQDSKNKPTVSIITVVYNGEESIARTIESVCAQTVWPDEYLIIDGNSTDSTVMVVKAYSRHYPFIKLVSKNDGGIYDAMNKGIVLASGQLIGLINSDDWYEPEAIELMRKAYQQNGAGVYYGIQRMWKGGQEYLLERAHHDFLALKMIPHPATFVSADLYAQFGAFDLTYRYAADLELMIRYRRARVKFYPLDQVIANFRIGGASSTPKAALESLKIRRASGLLGTGAYTYHLLKLNLKNLMNWR